ncbi:MAG TPA: class I SAM-dependent methyltransferase [Gemmataceae bacterium]|jgi:2-polyprenyl-3-methyl-5-hydroxy-6-metoxy-1,4-benzoquinol methylase
MSEHDRALAAAFDNTAAQFERAPVQNDPNKLAHLIQVADLPAGGRILDAGCGPGLVAETLLQAGYRVMGVDLSAEMIARARKRCARFGDRASFEQKSLFDPSLAGPFDGAISRFVLHHTPDPLAFVRRQVELLRQGGVLATCDHTTDPDRARRDWHQRIERARDHTHTSNPTPTEMVDLFIAAGLNQLHLIEDPLELDFDEWFDRGTPAEDKETVRQWCLSGSSARGYTPQLLPDGRIRIDGWIAIVRGIKSI